jgi:hypothetical protein
MHRTSNSASDCRASSKSQQHRQTEKYSNNAHQEFHKRFLMPSLTVLLLDVSPECLAARAVCAIDRQRGIAFVAAVHSQ